MRQSNDDKLKLFNLSENKQMPFICPFTGTGSTCETNFSASGWLQFVTLELQVTLEYKRSLFLF
jgi:hypothetical protein